MGNHRQYSRKSRTTKLNTQTSIDFARVEEIWKEIIDYPDYLVSNNGLVKSVDRMIVKVIHGISVDNKVNGALLKSTIDYGGSCRVKLYHNKLTKNKSVHRLVAAAFIPNPQNKRTVNHKNGIRHDNRVENLEWATHSEQQTHSFKVLNKQAPFKGKFGINHNKSKSIVCITNGNTYGSLREAERELGVNNSIISAQLSGRLKHAGGFTFRFVQQTLTYGSKYDS